MNLSNLHVKLIVKVIFYAVLIDHFLSHLNVVTFVPIWILPEINFELHSSLVLSFLRLFSDSRLSGDQRHSAMC